MSQLQLVIGNKNYSTWSLRPWLLLTHFNLPFDEVAVSLATPNLSEKLAEFSDFRKVPVLNDYQAGNKGGDKLTVWDSLAICEQAKQAIAA